MRMAKICMRFKAMRTIDLKKDRIRLRFKTHNVPLSVTPIELHFETWFRFLNERLRLRSAITYKTY